MTTLVIGAVLALVALAFVLYPLFAPPRTGAAVASGAGDAGVAPDAAPLERERALAALREIELEHGMGKLSDADYERLRTRYAPLAEPPAAGDDPVEGFISSYRERHAGARAICPVCGVRPEPDARYCSTCGRALGGSCRQCGTAADPDARFCASCGAALAP